MRRDFGPRGLRARTELAATVLRMKIVVFGATGGTGKQLVERALAEGHDVVAVARRPEAITVKHAHLHVMKGDVLDPSSMTAAVAGADAVLSAIGPANGKQPGTLISIGVKHIVEACARAGVRRFVFESGLMVGDGRGLSVFGRLAISIYRSLYKKLCADKRVAEATIKESSLDWVIVRPVGLDDGPATGKYRAGVDIRLSPTKKLSHADVAEFMVKAAVKPELVHTIQDIGH
jgi:putative NADH-flavin reductase